MDLFLSPNNPIPPGAAVAQITASDGIYLRVARWTTPGEASRGTVAILTGRAEFIERYYEVIGELLARQFDVVAMDWRGQGLSERQLRDRRKGHVDDFDNYQLDLAALHEQVLEPFCAKPWFALAHSMGAANLIAQARTGKSPFARIIATSPMIALAGLRMSKAASFGAEVFDILGFGGAYIPGGRRKPVFLRTVHAELLTSDEARYRRTAEMVEIAPALGLGDPTIGWTNAAYRLMRQFEDADYPRRTHTPILIVAAGADHVVSTPAIESFASRLKAGRFITVPYAKHEILQERDVFRAQFWAAFDSFIPGVHDRVAQSAAAAIAARKRKRSFWPWHGATASP